MIDVFAFQEALLIEAAFAIVILAMIWAGFRRWLQYKEKMGRIIAEETAQRSVQYGARMERVEARLNAVEQTMQDDGVQAAGAIEAIASGPPSIQAQPATESGESVAKRGGRDRD